MGMGSFGDPTMCVCAWRSRNYGVGLGGRKMQLDEVGLTGFGGWVPSTPQLFDDDEFGHQQHYGGGAFQEIEWHPPGAGRS